MNYSKLTKEQSKDSGLVLVLLCAIAALHFNLLIWKLALIVFLVLSLTVPRVFKPFAFLWFNLAEILSKYVSRVLLAVIYFAVITPVSLIRRVFGSDPMREKQWKQGHASVFEEVHTTYQASHLKHPF